MKTDFLYRLLPARKMAGSLLAALLLLGCDVVNQDPLSDLTQEQFFQTRTDAQAVLFATYDATQALVEEMFVYGEGRGDLVMDSWGMNCCGRNGQDNLRLWQQIVTPDNGFTSWTNWYQLINRANTVIKYVPGIADPAFLAVNRDEITGQAQYLRALAYFYLVRNFGDVPLVTEPSESSEQDFAVPRTPAAGVLAQIETDLSVAATKLKTFNGGANNRTTVTYGAVNALLTEVYLWQDKFQAALDASLEVQKSPVVYALMPVDPNNTRANGGKTSDFTKIFWQKNNSEIIFALAFDASRQETQPLQRMTDFARGGSYQYQPSLKARNLWAGEADNVRGDGASYRGGLTGDARIWKWIGVDAGTQLPNSQASDRDWILHRLADVLLLRAEALNRLDRKQEAIDLVNQLRARVGLPATPVSAASTTEDIEDAILKERALELAYEGKRWFDLVRVGKRRKNVLVSNVAAVVDGTSSAFRKDQITGVLNDPRSWVLPINRNELLSNTQLEQNEYYR